MTTVHLLGGGALDNYYWVSETRDCVQEELKVRLAQINLQHQIEDHAYDRFTSQSTLEGGIVGRGLGECGNLRSYRKYKKIDPNDVNHRVEPLKALKASVLANPAKTHFVVLSTGEEDLMTQAGVNEFRIRRTNPLRLLWEIPGIQARYLEIMHQLHELKGNGVKPILMTQFRWDPHQDYYRIYRAIKIIGTMGIALQGVCLTGVAVSIWSVLARKAHLVTAGVFAFSAAAYYGSTFMLTFKATLGILRGQALGATTLGCLLERFYTPILNQAKKNGIPIFDLTNSLNTCGRKPDGTNKAPGLDKIFTVDPCDNPYITQDAPTRKGGKIIAKGICHILKNHNFEGESKIYYREPKTFTRPKPPKSTFQAYPNPGGHAWTVNYPKQKLEKV